MRVYLMGVLKLLDVGPMMSSPMLTGPHKQQVTNSVNKDVKIP